jgi:exodeoxyribonuclease V alpha subunit
MSTLPATLRESLEREGLRPVDIALADWGWRHGGERAGALGLALANHAIGLGHTCLPLDALREAIGPASRLVNSERFTEELGANALVATPHADAALPLILDGNHLYLQRYWAYERRLAARLRELLAAPPTPVDTERLGPDGELFSWDWTASGETNWQAVAAFVAQRHRFAVISGGPGTGKTYTIVRLMLQMVDSALANHEPPPVFRLAAPTGKAAARMITSVRTGLLAMQTSAVAEQHLPTEATTLHRLLRLRHGSTEPGHDRERPIPADVVIVDEASMVDLPMMAKLADAVPDHARLILLGDRYQLASVESGAVLADLCAPAGVNAFSGEQRTAAGGLLPESDGGATPSALADHVVTLQTSHRFHADSPIGRLAAAINAGDAEGVESVLTDRGDKVRAIFDTEAHSIQRLISGLADAYATLHQAETPQAAIDALEDLRLLTATRVGPLGSEQINLRVGAALAERFGFDHESPWYHGRPIMIVQNEPRAGLFNGDVGVVWHDADGHIRVWFRTEDGLRSFHPSVLPAHDTVYAMTIHKSQGSEFEAVYLLLPHGQSRVLTRELLYTAVTRARRVLETYGSRDVWQAGVRNRIQRYSGIGERLNAPD